MSVDGPTSPTWTSFWCGQGPIANLTRPRFACDSSGTIVQSTYQKVALWKACLNCEWYAFGHSDHRIESHIMHSVAVRPNRNDDWKGLITNTLLHHKTCLFDKYILSCETASWACFLSTAFKESRSVSSYTYNQSHFVCKHYDIGAQL